MKRLYVILSVLVLAGRSSIAGETQALAEKRLFNIVLNDQYDVPNPLVFPATNLVLLTIADKKGSEQVKGWIVPLKERYAGKLDIRGLADMGKVPGFLRARVRKKFQETTKYPVMMDWSGKVCAAIGYTTEAANILLLAPDGLVKGRFYGEASRTNLQAIFLAIDAAAHSVSNLTIVNPIPTSRSGQP